MGQARDEAGNIWETDAQGNALRLISAAGSAPQMPADPTFNTKAPQAQASLNNTVADATVNQATIPAQITAANADATIKTRTSSTAGLPEGFMWDGSGQRAVPIPGYTRQGLSPEIRSQAIQVYTDAGALERAADEIERLYNEGPGATKGIWGLQDYLPNETNKVFNDAGQQARGYVKRALGFTGGEGNTATEASALYDPYLPTARDRDGQIVRKIEKLRELANDARQKSVTTLGGVPDQSGNIVPRMDPSLSAMNQPFEVGGGRQAATGTKKQIDIPEKMQQEWLSYYARNRGNWDAGDAAKFRVQLDAKYNFPTPPGAFDRYYDHAAEFGEALRSGGRVNPTIPGPEVEMTKTEIGRNQAINNPVGAAFANYGNMQTLGIPEMLAGSESFQALGEAQPVGTMIGQIGGAIGGTAALGKFGKETLGRALPQLLGGGGKARFGRNLAADMTFSGAYGATTGQDPLGSAAMGGLGSVAGQGVGKALGGIVGGAALSPQVQRLRAQGIPLTTGQMLGGIPKAIEDGMTSVPGIGDLASARRLEGFRAFNQAAFNEAGQPIGAKVADLGEDGVGALMDQVGNSYNDATAGVNVPLDPTFTADMATARAAGAALPGDYAGKFNAAIENRVGPVANAGELTGDSYQQAMRGLKGYRAEMTKPGFDQDYRDALSVAMDALRGQMQRGGGQSVVDGLARSDQAYKSAKVLERAIQAAKNGTVTGEIQIFTPSQLNTAATMAKNKFGGQRPFSGLIDDGQSVLPSQVPDSGTGRRLATMALPGFLGGGAALGGAAAYPTGDTSDGILKGAIVAAALLGGGTKAGQKTINTLIAGRPESVRKVGRAIGKRKGLFGSAAIPLALESGK